MARKKPTHGGVRLGAGRPPDPGAKQQATFRLDPQVLAYLRSRKNATATIEWTIMCTEEFRLWRAQQPATSADP